MSDVTAIMKAAEQCRMVLHIHHLHSKSCRAVTLLLPTGSMCACHFQPEDDRSSQPASLVVEQHQHGRTPHQLMLNMSQSTLQIPLECVMQAYAVHASTCLQFVSHSHLLCRLAQPKAASAVPPCTTRPQQMPPQKPASLLPSQKVVG